MNTIAENKFTDAITEMAKTDIEGAIMLVTGCFIGLTLEYMKRSGYGTDGEILINGGSNRDITIHPIKKDTV